MFIVVDAMVRVIDYDAEGTEIILYQDTDVGIYRINPARLDHYRAESGSEEVTIAVSGLIQYRMFHSIDVIDQAVQSSAFIPLNNLKN